MILVKQMPLAVLVVQPVRVVHPAGTGREMQCRTQRLPQILVSNILTTHQAQILPGCRDKGNAARAQ